MILAPINKIIPFSYVDGYGNRTAVFLQKCNQDCIYCHNPETINLCCSCGECIAVCPPHALSINEGTVCYDITKCCNCDTCLKTCTHGSSPKIQWLTPSKVIELIGDNLPYIDGITTSGGECTLYTEFLTELFSLMKAKGKTTYIDTNGQIPLWNNDELLAVTDKTMIDLKSGDCEEHIKLTGLDNTNVLENIRHMALMDKLYEIRTVVVPHILDNLKTVEIGSRLIAGYDNVRYKLIKFRPFGVRPEWASLNVPEEEYMQMLKETALSYGVKDVVIV